MTGSLPVPEAITPESPHRVRRPVMLQDWSDLTSLHWRYQPPAVQARLPPGFRVDTFDGSAWVGVLPFHMERVRLPGIPAFGSLSTFPETNVRTYIIDPLGRRGVWFFSLDITRLVPALVARMTYGLPYCWAAMTIDGDGRGDGATRAYSSQRRWPRCRASTRIEVRIGPRLEPSSVTPLDHFLTARWALGSMFGRRHLWADVEHGPWPIHRAEVLDLEENLVGAAGLPAPLGDPIARWSPGVQVRIARPRWIKRPD